MRRPEVLRSRDFNLYWTGVVLSEIGSRGTAAAVLFHVYQITGSSLQVGLVGLAQAVVLLVVLPLGGAFADRLDRRRLLQVSQLVSLAASLGLAIVTLTGAVRTWHIIIAVMVNFTAVSFERPARDALIPALVPREHLPKAFALLNPTREVAILIGPAIAGGLIAVWNPAAVYLLDVLTYVVIIVALFFVRIPPVEATRKHTNLWASIGEGFSYVRSRPIILQLIGIDLAATLFATYRVLLPALATDVLGVGAGGYGILAAVPSAGALIGSAVAYRAVDRIRSGWIVIGSTVGYGFAAMSLGLAVLAPVSIDFAAALVAAAALGFFDATSTTVRHAVVQLEVPDHMRGRVTSIHSLASRGGPALGNLNLGWIATVAGPVLALSIGGLVPIAVATGMAMSRSRLFTYSIRTTVEEVESK